MLPLLEPDMVPLLVPDMLPLLEVAAGGDEDEEPGDMP
jgi:hypothetical protein